MQQHQTFSSQQDRKGANKSQQRQYIQKHIVIGGTTSTTTPKIQNGDLQFMPQYKGSFDEISPSQASLDPVDYQEY